MDQVHVFVDLENNQPTLDDLRDVVPGFTDVWLFHSPKQSKHLQSFEALGERRTLIPISRPGRNSLDFHLAFYLGYIAARNPTARLVVVAIDGGYGPMIEHARTLGFDVARVPFGKAGATKKAALKKSAVKKPAAKKPAAEKKPVAKKAAAKESTSTKIATKKPIAKKVAGKNVAVEKAAGKKIASTKKAVEKTAKAKIAIEVAPSRGVEVSVVPTEKATVAQASAGIDASIHVPELGQALLAIDPSRALKRMIAALRKMGAKRPKKLKALQRHVAVMLGNAATDVAVAKLVGELRNAGILQTAGNAVTYTATFDGPPA